MNDNEPKPRYFRLLEKGNKEKVQSEDYAIENHELTAYKERWPELIGTTVWNLTVLRPVQVDEWIPYAERKPTKEDFEPTGNIETFFKDKEVQIRTHQQHTDWDTPNNGGKFWRRITPPTPAKPKSKIVKLNNGTVLTVKTDGSAELGCGDTLSAESIDEFIKVHEEVTGKKSRE